MILHCTHCYAPHFLIRFLVARMNHNLLNRVPFDEHDNGSISLLLQALLKYILVMYYKGSFNLVKSGFVWDIETIFKGCFLGWLVEEKLKRVFRIPQQQNLGLCVAPTLFSVLSGHTHSSKTLLGGDPIWGCLHKLMEERCFIVEALSCSQMV